MAISAPPRSTTPVVFDCPTSTRCDALECSSSTNLACDVFFPSLPPDDGTSCGAASQCLNSQCVSSTTLKEYAWQAGAWSACAGGTQTRTVVCRDETGTLVADALCDAATRPVSVRGC